MAFEIIHGDCLEVMRGMADNSVDAVVTDPPYGLSFMGKKWDYDVPSVEVWAECLRVLKPGGHLLAFAGTRTQHRMAVRIEDAGFEIRDMIAWVYGSGFPKSLDVSKAIDKAAGAEREIVGPGRWNHVKGSNDEQENCLIRPGGKHSETAPATDAARQWQGWGTALKPALEPITMARKPLIGTVAANVLEHGTGAINVDACRVLTDDDLNGGRYSDNKQGDDGNSYGRGINERSALDYVQPPGRWPANLIHDGSEEVLEAFPVAKGQQGDLKGHNKDRESPNGVFGRFAPAKDHAARIESDTSAARFFYCAKASRSDRNAGLADPGPQFKHGTTLRQVENAEAKGNNHPTVKPTDLMAYLCRLVTPPGGTVLDPFTGSGSTGRGAVLEGFSFIGIEREAEYIPIAEARIAEAQKSLGLFA